MMRAAWYERNGTAEAVLRVGVKPTPEPGAGEVRVRIHCSGVNPSDVKSRADGCPVNWDCIIPHRRNTGCRLNLHAYCPA